MKNVISRFPLDVGLAGPEASRMSDFELCEDVAMQRCSIAQKHIQQ
jgi:hypothetical protein